MRLLEVGRLGRDVKVKVINVYLKAAAKINNSIQTPRLRPLSDSGVYRVLQGYPPTCLCHYVTPLTTRMRRGALGSFVDSRRGQNKTGILENQSDETRSRNSTYDIIITYGGLCINHFFTVDISFPRYHHSLALTVITVITMSSVFRPFPLPLTGRQWFYLTFLQGVGAGFIDGGANFGIAYASESTLVASPNQGFYLSDLESVLKLQCTTVRMWSRCGCLAKTLSPAISASLPSSNV